MIVGFEVPEENVPFVKKWIDALRSGDYDQATGRLRGHSLNEDTKPRFCCLGVATNLLDGVWENSYAAGWAWRVKDKMGLYSSMPSPEFYEAIWGVGVPDPMADHEVVNYFSTMNDTYLMTFAQIANAAEDLISDQPIDFVRWKDKHRRLMRKGLGV